MEKVNHYKIGINDLQIPVCTGIRTHERQTPQPVIVDVEMLIAYSEQARLDENVPSYSTVRQAIIDAAQRSHVPLLENLGSKLCRVCLGHCGVVHVKIRLCKPRALPDARVFIEMEGIQ